MSFGVIGLRPPLSNCQAYLLEAPEALKIEAAIEGLVVDPHNECGLQQPAYLNAVKLYTGAF